MHGQSDTKTTSSGYGWANALPPKQGLYDPANERDACGVGFIINIKGKASHQILQDSEDLLCHMSHRGAVGADMRDGDGAGVMTAIPHKFFSKAFESLGCKLPAPGAYATGNLFFHQDKQVRDNTQHTFEEIAQSVRLQVLGWRTVPCNSALLSPSGQAKEPVIVQPLVVPTEGSFVDAAEFSRRLFVLRKRAQNEIGHEKWFYICSLAPQNIVYKGLLTPAQVPEYFLDLRDDAFETHFALVHSRFSTNTFPSWERAQPFHWCAHNGEINTLRGNKNWMRAREGIIKSKAFGKDLEGIFPIIDEIGSDSAAFNNVLELLVINGVLTMPEAVMVMVPEAWQNNPLMSEEKRAFYEWASCIMEPWDGPALFTFSDGRYCGASLDRNGLRPCRYYITEDDRMICGSEVGAVKVDPSIIKEKGRLMPGRMLLVDTMAGEVVDDEQLKLNVSRKHPFRQWIDKHQITIEHLAPVPKPIDIDSEPISRDCRLRAFGYSAEQLNLILSPMVQNGKEPLGSMGNDTVLACLDDQPRLAYEYFRELFAQVTNPPIDPIREKIVMSLRCHVGPEGNLLEIAETQAHRLSLDSPVLTNSELAAIRNMSEKYPSWPTRTLDITFPAADGISGYTNALDRVCAEAVAAIDNGAKVIILSDRAISCVRAPLSMLLAAGAVHQRLVVERLRAKVALMVETGEARETHHFCVLVGYGVDAVCPYVVYEAIAKLHRENVLSNKPVAQLVKQFRAAVDDGFRKVMSKMGISTMQSYKGAQIFEALGISADVIDRCFAGTASRVGGTTLEGFAADSLARHAAAYPSSHNQQKHKIAALNDEGEYNWRKGGSTHINTPKSIASLQDAVRTKNRESWQKYVTASEESVRASTIRGLLDFDKTDDHAIPLDEVEPWTSIVRRFCTGAMSYGSISKEAHTALAVAMNRIGGKSNSGEGGEDPSRSIPTANGDSQRSAIKQVASGRFGVTSNYLADADELQIKMAQGAKAGEGGELLGSKISKEIAKTRHTTPGVTLVSPPPHHDIYSIEDLKQLIFDLKSANSRARVSVKLVSEVGVGVVAAGVVKALADHILVAGHDGGTGAARWTGIKYAGLPWELGLAEMHQTLVLNDLRGRVVLQTDGQLKTAKDVAIAALLGAEEFGFATTPLITLGCVYLRRCHQNSCAVGVATQDPVLRAKFRGQPEHVINFFHYLAEDLRALMASLGFRTIAEMVGHSERLRVREDYACAKGALDLDMLLKPAHAMRPGVATHNVMEQDHALESRLDSRLLPQLVESLQTGKPVSVSSEITNIDRAFGTILSYHLSTNHGLDGLPQGTINLHLRGSAGQSLGAFLAPGIAIDLEGDANDYVGKGLSGGQIVVYPPHTSNFAASRNVIVGNVCLFGATSGEAFISGIAAERFAVRNSGALAVVEGVGDHGCEYMTGGRVIVLGNVGRNFAAGMSGGIAYVLADNFRALCNTELVELETVHGDEAVWLKSIIERHVALTGSERGREVLRDFSSLLPKFVKVFPTDYKRVLADAKKEEEVVDDTTEHKAPKIENDLVDIEDALIDESQLDDRAKKLDKLRGFIKYNRRADKYRNPKRRVNDWNEISMRQSKAQLQVQAARCIDCGVPFCQSDVDGCPIGNVIPKWNELIFKNQWRDAFDRLMATNNFPEFTGRVCPAPCEGACVAGLVEQPVAIKSIEAAIIDHAWDMGWMAPVPPPSRTGKAVAIIGSGPAGLAAAEQLNNAGHSVTVYEREDRIGGLLTYGIPNMKLDKRLVQRRVDKLSAEGVRFVTNAHVGITHSSREIAQSNDALLLATGATWPRDLPIEGRSLDGVHFAMEFLTENTKSLLATSKKTPAISAKDKRVIVIGGGDTGNDCIGTAVRHGAASVVNFELLPCPPKHRAADNPWPQFPRVYRVDYGHEEVVSRWGSDPREYCVSAKRFVGGSGHIEGIETVRVEWTKDSAGRWAMEEVPGSEEFYPADLVFLAMGFLGPENKVIEDLAVAQGVRSNIDTRHESYSTNIPGVFAAGDCRRGQSLVVWGINEGRQAAREIDHYLTSHCSNLPVSGGIIPRTVSC